tara:strand:- start:53495 stop:53863 length:369 start_codon:yes stop_codon:yes gene_type:complete
MAVTHSAATRNAIADAVLADIDIDAGAGTLEFQTSGAAEVATLTLTDPAGSVSGAVLTFSAITDDTSATGGTVDRFVIKSNLGGDRVLGNVLTSGGDINLSSLVVGVGDTVSISSLTYTAAP